MGAQLAPPLTTHVSDRPSATTVSLHADDPISRAGMASSLADRRLSMVGDGEDPDVAVVVCDQFDDATLRRIRRARRSGDTGVVLVVTELDDDGLYLSLIHI